MGQSLELDISRFTGNNMQKGNILVRRTGIAMYQGVTSQTPVKTGRCRANWRCKVNEIDLTTDNNTQFDGLRAAVSFGKAEIGDTLNVSNNLPYAEGLEEGNSTQAPNGMMHVTLEDVKEKLKSGEFKGDI